MGAGASSIASPIGRRGNKKDSDKRLPTRLSVADGTGFSRRPSNTEPTNSRVSLMARRRRRKTAVTNSSTNNPHYTRSGSFRQEKSQQHSHHHHHQPKQQLQAQHDKHHKHHHHRQQHNEREQSEDFGSGRSQAGAASVSSGPTSRPAPLQRYYAERVLGGLFRVDDDDDDDDNHNNIIIQPKKITGVRGRPQLQLDDLARPSRDHSGSTMETSSNSTSSSVRWLRSNNLLDVDRYEKAPRFFDDELDGCMSVSASQCCGGGMGGTTEEGGVAGSGPCMSCDCRHQVNPFLLQ